MKIIVDMCLSPKWVDALNAAGFDARHWSSLGAGDAPDSSIFDFARQDDSVILTADLDFGALLAGARSGKPSVVQLRLPRISLEKAREPTLGALTQFRSEIEAGALVTIDAVSARVRILPIA